MDIPHGLFLLYHVFAGSHCIAKRKPHHTGLGRFLDIWSLRIYISLHLKHSRLNFPRDRSPSFSVHKGCWQDTLARVMFFLLLSLLSSTETQFQRRPRFST